MLLRHLSTSSNLIAICLSSDLNLLQGSTLTPANNSGPLRLSVPSHSLDSTTHNEIEWYCDGQTFGFPTFASCLSAYDQIPDNDTVETWGRLRSPWQPPYPNWALPHRFISDDGTCAIDVDILGSRSHIDQESATSREIKQAASWIVGDCSRRPVGEGGMATGLGHNGYLQLTVRTYEPDVRCLDPSAGVPSPRVCESQMLELPPAWIPGLKQFDGAAEWIWIQAGLQCTVRLAAYASGPNPVQCDWGTIYHAAVAVLGMCVRRGLGGVATVPSTEPLFPGRLTIMLRNDAPQSDTA